MDEMGQITKETILEIRYLANPLILDYRGLLAEGLKGCFNLEHWQIDTNRIDIFDESKSFRLFVSHRNCGTVIRNSSTRNFFADQSNKFYKYLSEQKCFRDSIKIERIGIRSRFGFPSENSFSELLHIFTAKYCPLTDKVINSFNGDLIDYGVPAFFKTSHGIIHSSVGPMENDQYKEYFPFIVEQVKSALYIDLDYWDKPNREMDFRSISNTIKTYSEESWDIAEKIYSIIIDN